MANLIITVISIALVAVAALMGAYYGGSAFMDGQAKSYANTVISQAEQVSAAYQLYNINNGVSSGPSGFVGNYLVPNYIQQMPSPPEAIKFSPGSNFCATTLAAWNNCSGTAGGDVLILYMANTSLGKKVCSEITKAANGPTAVPLVVDFPLALTKKYDCFGLSYQMPVFAYRAI